MTCPIAKAGAVDDWREITRQNYSILKAVGRSTPGVSITVYFGVPMAAEKESASNCQDWVFQQTVRDPRTKIR